MDLSTEQAGTADFAVAVARRIYDGLGASRDLLHADKVTLAAAVLPAVMDHLLAPILLAQAEISEVDISEPSGKIESFPAPYPQPGEYRNDTL